MRTAANDATPRWAIRNRTLGHEQRHVAEWANATLGPKPINTHTHSYTAITSGEHLTCDRAPEGEKANV